MASLKFALAAVALSAVVINSVVADEAAQAANLDGGYPKFPSRLRRASSVPTMPEVPSGLPNPSSISSYKPPSIPQMPNGVPTNVPTIPSMPAGGYEEYMKPEKWQQQISNYVQKPNNGKPNDNGNRPEAPQTEIGDDDETKCS